MTPTEGMILRSKTSEMVVVCLENKIDCDPSMMFRGKVIDPGKLHNFHAKGDEMHTLNSSDFNEFDPLAYKRVCYSYLDTLKKNSESKLKINVTPKDAIWAAIGLFFVGEMKKEGLI